LAEKYPHGLSAIPELPEERSGEISRIGIQSARNAAVKQTSVDPEVLALPKETVLEGATV
jgi:hypothetical protein